MKNHEQFLGFLNKSIKDLFYDALRVSYVNLPQAWFVLKNIIWQRKAAKTRDFWEKQNLHVPPFAIVSITQKCNLKCKGCYAQAHHKPGSLEMSEGELENIFNQANELGLSIILLAGGEPLVRREILRVTQKFARIIFPLFTNGLLIDRELIKEFKKQRNLVPVISIEGYQEETDERRGKGVYEHIKQVFREFNESKIFYGVSITVTRANYDMVICEQFAQDLIASGCKLFFFVEYVPFQDDTEDLVLTDEQKAKILDLVNSFREKLPALFIAFPGDEEAFGGCLAAGRGFIHINPEGSVEPCPFAPYSDTSLKKLPLKEALKSEFLKNIRENHQTLQSGTGGCALWENRELVQSLLRDARPDNEIEN